MTPAEISGLFAAWGQGWEEMGSPLMGRLGRALTAVLDDSTDTGRGVLGWTGDPKADALPIRVTGGLNALQRSGRHPELAALYPPNPLPPQEEFERVLREQLPRIDGELLPWLDHAPQTNEVGRAGVIWPALMRIAARTGLPLRLFELGASAGLTLNLDRFHYRLGKSESGAADAAVRLSPEWSGPDPETAPVRISERRGVDISPLDARDPAVRERLMAFCWADQIERVERLQAALDLAQQHPPELDAADAAGWTEQVVEPQAGHATVVFHTIAFQYFPAESQRRIADYLHRRGNAASSDAPLFWLRFEDEYVGTGIAPTLRLTSWPGGTEEHLADAHPHGSRISWHGG